MNELGIVAVVAWLMCGAVAYTATFTYFQTKYDLIADEVRTQDRAFATLIGLAGPLGLVTVTLMGGFRYGLGKW